MGKQEIDRGAELFDLILSLLPREPRSYDTSEDTGFWTNGEEILCPSETDCDIVADFLEDVFRGKSSAVIKTGYYDPFEDAKNGEQDDNTGFYCIDIE